MAVCCFAVSTVLLECMMNHCCFCSQILADSVAANSWMCCLSMGIAVYDKCLRSALLCVGDLPAPW